jgi:hypothetical protein
MATLNGKSAKAEGRTKKVAEKEAAQLLLQQSVYIDAPLLDTNSTVNNTVMWEPPRGAWNYFEREDDTMIRLNLSTENNQTRKRNHNASSTNTAEDWWMDHAFVEKHAFRAAMLAPTIFPKVVMAVNSWTLANTAEDWWMEHAFVDKHAFRASMLAPTIFQRLWWRSIHGRDGPRKRGVITLPLPAAEAITVQQSSW